MSQSSKISISLNTGSITEYLIRDKNNINIGRFQIIDLDKENRKCDIKLKFYRDDNYNLIKETLENLLRATFKDKDMYKVNVMVGDGIKTSPFLDLGFILEGIISDNLIINGTSRDELVFGINREDYNYKNCEPILKLEGKRIYLRNLTPNDSEEMLDYYKRNKDHLEKFEPVRDSEFYTLDIQRSILNESYKQFLNGSSVDFAIIKDTNIIGKIRVSNIVYGVFKNGIIGYSIDKDFEGNGYMREALLLAIKYSFEDLGLHRVEASALLDNHRSNGLLKRCGFNELGTNEKYLFINGVWQDHKTYYKLKE